MSELTLAPPNAILFICDSSAKDIQVPTYQAEQLASATKTCVSVGTRADVDGDTTIYLVSNFSEIADPPKYQVFEGIITVPSKVVIIMTAYADTLLQKSTRNETVTVRVWVDDLDGPSRILFVVE